MKKQHLFKMEKKRAQKILLTIFRLNIDPDDGDFIWNVFLQFLIRFRFFIIIHGVLYTPCLACNANSRARFPTTKDLVMNSSSFAS